jgi:hypothetical protein
VPERYVALDYNGRRIGDSHHRTRIPDAVVLAIRELHEHEFVPVREIAERMRISYTYARKLVYYERRISQPVTFRLEDSPPTALEQSEKVAEHHGKAVEKSGETEGQDG